MSLRLTCVSSCLECRAQLPVSCRRRFARWVRMMGAQVFQINSQLTLNGYESGR